MSVYVGKEDGEKYNVLLIEIQFVLVEFYLIEGKYLLVLDCLRILEENLFEDI